MVQIQPKAQPAKPHLEQQQAQNRLRHHCLGKQADDPGKRACQVICENAHKFAAERAFPGIKQRAALRQHIAQLLKIIDILPVEIKRHAGIFSERPDGHEHINHIHHRDRNQKSQNQIQIFIGAESGNSLPQLLFHKQRFLFNFVSCRRARRASDTKKFYHKFRKSTRLFPILPRSARIFSCKGGKRCKAGRKKRKKCEKIRQKPCQAAGRMV